MHVTIRRYSGSPDLADALVARQGEVRDLITGIAGFKAYYLVRGGDGEASSISVFDDEAGGEESSRRAAAWLRESVPDLSVGPPEVTAGEAVLSF
jgi:heme-degrading monooxygenase HmoA